MKMASRAVFAAVLPIALILSGCASNNSTTSHSSLPNPTQKTAGFLPDYSLLKPVSGVPEGVEIYRYTAPNVQRGDYHAVMIMPVMLYQTATENGIEKDQLTTAQADLQSGIEKVVRHKMRVVNSAGPGVIQLSVAITGAVVDGQGLKPRNLLPISAAILLASKATGVDEKTPSMMVELKFVDSQTNQLVREVVTVIHGETFRDKSETTTALDSLAQEWVKQAMQYSSGAMSQSS